MALSGKIDRNVISKSKICKEDIEWGEGTVRQKRFGKDIVLHKVNLGDFPINESTTLKEFSEYLRDNKTAFENAIMVGDKQAILINALGEVSDELIDVLSDATDQRPDRFFKRFSTTMSTDQYIPAGISHVTAGDTIIEDGVELFIDYGADLLVMSYDMLQDLDVLDALQVHFDSLDSGLDSNTVDGALRELAHGAALKLYSDEVKRPEPDTRTVEESLVANEEAIVANEEAIVEMGEIIDNLTTLTVLDVEIYGDMHNIDWLSLDDGGYYLSGIPSQFSNIPIDISFIGASEIIACEFEIKNSPTQYLHKCTVTTTGGTYHPPMMFERSGSSVLTDLMLRPWSRLDHGGVAISYGEKGSTAFVMGINNPTGGLYSTTVGVNARVTGYHTSGFGYGAQATGDYSSAIGYNAQATATNCSAFGVWATATQYDSSAFGQNSGAKGRCSSAFGKYAQATGDYSSAIGYNVQATGDYSSAFGYGAYATSENRMVLGTSSTSVYLGSGSQVTSDRRDKTDINTIPSSEALALIDKFSPVSFYYDHRDRYTDMDEIRTNIDINHRIKRVRKRFPNSKIKLKEKEVLSYHSGIRDGSKRNKHATIGLIAQDVLEVMNDANIPKASIVSEADPEQISMDYSQIIPLLIGAVQELSKEVTALKEKFNDR